jgi:hypothetical protein
MPDHKERWDDYQKNENRDVSHPEQYLLLYAKLHAAVMSSLACHNLLIFRLS